MSNTNQTSTGTAPTHILYQVRDGQKEKSYWTRIGVAWAHTDGKGLNVQLEAIPLDGRITLRESKK